MFRIKPFVICEVFATKSALYFDDNDYHLDKLGSFISYEFDINIGGLGSSTNGSVTIPMHLELNSPIKVGDVVNVSLVNFGHESINTVYAYNAINISGKYFQEIDDKRNQLQQAFVVSAIDNDRLVLTDYNEFNHSLFTVGYVGAVNNIHLSKLIEMITRRDMRAFPCKMYPVNDKRSTPFRFNFEDQTVSFADDFTATNVKPYEILKKALSSLDKILGITLGAVVKEDAGGYYVFSYMRKTIEGAVNNYNVRIKPGKSVRLSNNENTAAATIWIQPEDNGEDYIRAGVIISSNDGHESFKTVGQIESWEFSKNNLTEVKTILVGYHQLFEGFEKEKATRPKAPDKTLFKSDEEYKAAKEAYKTKLEAFENESKKNEDEIKTLMDGIKKELGDPIKPITIKELLADAFGGYITNKPAIGSGEFSTKWYSVILENLRKIVKSNLSTQFTPITISVNENDIFLYGVEFSGDENVNIFYTNRFGAGLSGDLATISQVNYTPNGRTYTFKTTGKRR